MSKLEKFQSYLPPIYNDITEIQKILDTESTEYETLESNIDSVENNIFIVDAEDSGLKRYEKIFNITVPIGATLEDRRSVVKSVLRGIDKLSGTVIKNISLAYQNGQVNVSFTSGNIIIQFISTFGTPANMQELQKYLNARKPAHLSILYSYLYLSIVEVEAMTLAEIETIALDKFAF
jgi:hypothetical protein